MTSEIRKVYCTPEEQARLWLSQNGYRTLAGGSEYVSGPPLYEIMAQYHEWMTQAEKREDGAEPVAASVTDSKNTGNPSASSPELLPTQLPKGDF